MEPTLQELNAKLDLLSQQVAYLTEQAQNAERSRQQRAELTHDLAPIANQAYHMAIEQLEEVQEYIDLSDLLRFAKRLMRNGRNFEKMLDQLESLVDLMDTLGPLSDEAFSKLVATLSILEQKGYFNFTRSAMRIVDNIVTGFDEKHMEQLADNIVLILNTLQELTQPEIMAFVRNTQQNAEQELQKPLDHSWLGLLQQLRHPDVRRGLGLSMRVLQVVGAQSNTHKIEMPNN